MAKYWLAPLLFLLVLIPSAQATLGDSYYFTIQNDSIKCINLVLPDDMGVILPGKVEYKLGMVPGPYETWSDLSEQVVRTDENNTAVIPICFSSFGMGQGECGKPFVLTITSPGVPTKTVQGGVCVSGFADVDTSTAAGNQSVLETLGSSLDMFDLAFQRKIIYSRPGETKEARLRVESYAEIGLGLAVQSEADVIPASSSLTFGPDSPNQSIDYSITAPSEPGEYAVRVLATQKGCTETFCAKGTQLRLIVEDNPPEQTGWMVSLFPGNINIKELGDIMFTAVLDNMEDSGKEFTFSIDITGAADTDFQDSTTAVNGKSSEYIDFTVTPQAAASLYEITVTATSRGLSKTATAWLSTDEMFTDAIREANSIIGETADPDIRQEVGQSLDSFYQSYKDTDYGEETGAYSSLKDRLATERARVEADVQLPGPGGADPEPVVPATGGFNWLLVIVPVVIGVGAVAGFLWWRSRKGQGAMEVGFE